MRMSPLKPREVVYVLEKLGFREKRQTGSHKIFFHPLKKKIIPVPIHPKEIKRALLRAIIAQGGLKPKEFFDILKNQ